MAIVTHLVTRPSRLRLDHLDGNWRVPADGLPIQPSVCADTFPKTAVVRMGRCTPLPYETTSIGQLAVERQLTWRALVAHASRNQAYSGKVTFAGFQLLVDGSAEPIALLDVDVEACAVSALRAMNDEGPQPPHWPATSTV